MAEDVITAPTNVNEIKDYLTPAGSGFQLTSLELTGTLGAVGLFDSLALSSELTLTRGVLISSGSGNPERSNTASGRTTNNGLGGDGDLTAFAQAAFSGSGVTLDATVLTLTFTVTDPSVKSLSFDITFGSEEYPEFSSSDFVDIGAVWTGTGGDARNYALINGDVTTPLSVIDKNEELGNFINNADGALAIQYDGVVASQTILVPVTLGVNVIKIGVADTGDRSLDSGLFISNIRPSGSDVGGTFQEVEVTSGGTYDASESNFIFEGTASDLNNAVIQFFDELDQIFVEDSFFSELDVNLELGSLRLQLDTDGDGDFDTEITLADPAPNSTVKIASTSAGTSVTLELLAPATDGADAITGTEGLDYITGGLGADTLTGLGGSDALSGGAGGDALRGGAGRDYLDGGAGDDQLSGGADADVFFFDATAGSTGKDRITDFDMNDVLVTNVRIFDSNKDGVITFGANKLLDLAGGGTIGITDQGNKAVRALEYDGSYVADGVTYYVYSRLGSSAGLGSVIPGDDTMPV
ncbi:choice-of-anchor L domain-containing protein [Sphingomonas lenta]|uniref:Calcium-binding protein n=1 Tax=Sphingomonas lenta TaxID=1141887 RepID=A0A2A2SD95_9SPHN|nr:choice-of-anchor L domain-containing protein [Sphingomonas lenta]PAX07227.1 hypothetical protein CKY28_14440 [Sphingomonas lenta]